MKSSKTPYTHTYSGSLADYENQSPQFKRTTRAICHALMTLLKTRPFDEITVQDILDATPVTRSTFYKHFHDKYEIVEQMQEYYLSNQFEIRHLLLTEPRSPKLTDAFLTNRELLDILLKVHTEKVDIRQKLANQAKEHYLSRVNSPTANLEAEVYSHAQTAFQIANDKRIDFEFSYMDDIFISAFLMLLGLPNDEEITTLIHKKLAEKTHVFRSDTK